MSDEKLPDGIGADIRRCRKRKGLTLSETARMAGMSKAYLSQLENGQTNAPSIWIVFRLMSVLDMDIGHWQRQYKREQLRLRREAAQLYDGDFAAAGVGEGEQR